MYQSISLAVIIEPVPLGRKSGNVWGNKYHDKESDAQNSASRSENSARNVTFWQSRHQLPLSYVIDTVSISLVCPWLQYQVATHNWIRSGLYSQLWWVRASGQVTLWLSSLAKIPSTIALKDGLMFQQWKHRPISTISIRTRWKSTVGLAGLQKISMALTATSNEYCYSLVLTSIRSI